LLVGAIVLAVAIVVVVAIETSRSTGTGARIAANGSINTLAVHSPASTPTARSTISAKASPILRSQPWADPRSASGPGRLWPGSTPSALPVPVLIIDKFNNRLIVVDPQGRIRWQFPQAGDLDAGQTFTIPDDAFFTPDAREIVATQEDQQLITVIDIATRRIIYRYGSPGVSGSGPNQLSNPDDAIMLPDGYILSPDIKNCRILLLSTKSHQPARIIGTTTNNCRHAPPTHWGSPNGAFPMTDGRYLVTEINGDWVDALRLDGTVSWSTHPPGIAYPSDSNQIGADRFLTVDYSSPGQVLIFNHLGRALWRYRKVVSSGALDHPSLALPLPNGDVLLNDDYNHRVVVIDPRTDAIVWQYGRSGVAGIAPGYLNNPDGVDLVPPNSLLITHSKDMGLLPPLPAIG
jgi:DNA-binding beta-propeller fold protein YncE